MVTVLLIYQGFVVLYQISIDTIFSPGLSATGRIYAFSTVIELMCATEKHEILKRTSLCKYVFPELDRCM